jgi:hypothetical protein
MGRSESTSALTRLGAILYRCLTAKWLLNIEVPTQAGGAGCTAIVCATAGTTTMLRAEKHRLIHFRWEIAPPEPGYRGGGR